MEHRLARLVQLGIRQARYFGREKTLFQLAMAAAVANFTLIAARGDGFGSALTPMLTLLLLATAILMAFYRPQPARPASQPVRIAGPLAQGPWLFRTTASIKMSVLWTDL